MAKQQIVEFDNGATLVYQKQNVINGSSFVLGFRCGAQMDGKYKGLSHFLEHLLFSGNSEDFSENVFKNINKYTLDQNAFTSEHTIAVTFHALNKNINEAIQVNVEMLTNRNFSLEMMKKELEVVKQEARLKDEELYSSTEVIIKSLQERQQKQLSAQDIVGSARTLNQITPDILTDYMNKYFNLDNMVISVTSNSSLEDIQTLCIEQIFPHFTNASSTENIVPFPNEIIYQPVNLLYLNPNPDQNTVEISLMLRERNDRSENPDLEYAFDVVEEYIMNCLGGVMYKALRVNNNLVYSYSLQNLDLGTAKFKNFSCNTSPAKVRKTIKTLCEMIYNCAYEGLNKEQFETVKKMITDEQSATLKKFKSCSSQSNFNNLLYGVAFIDYKKVFNYISNMTYEDFNDYLTSIYRLGNVSVSVSGNFDTRKCYNIIEIEQMLGNYSHMEHIDEFNVPKMEYSPLAQPGESETVLATNGYTPVTAEIINPKSEATAEQ